MRHRKYFLGMALVALGTVGGCGGEELSGIASHEEALTASSEVVQNPGVNEAEEKALGNTDPTTEALSDCPSGYVCLWQDAEYKGRRVQWSDPGCKILGGARGFNDETSSWYNRNSRSVRFYWDTGCTGKSFVASPGERAPHMGNWGDEVSSICVGSGC